MSSSTTGSIDSGNSSNNASSGGLERPSGPLPPVPDDVRILDGEEVMKVAMMEQQQLEGKEILLAPIIQPNEGIIQGEEEISAIKETVKEDIIPTMIKGPSRTSSHESVCLNHIDELTYSMNSEDYNIGPAIGFGSSAIVYHAIYTPLNVNVAVKMIDLDHFERNQIDELRKEIQVMTLCKHPNLLKILTSFVNESKLWIVAPYMSGGSCLDIMKTGFREGLDEGAIATILVQALQGLEYLHRNGHIHRDVKAGNLLMDADGSVLLADFGVSSSLMEDMERKGVRRTFVGTPCWMAPEVMEMSKGYDCKADIWSFGITALELAYGHAPFAKYPPMKVIYLTLSSNPPILDRKRTRNKYSRSMADMISCCLQKDPSKRATAETLLKHPFFVKMVKKKSYLMQSILATIPPIEQRPRVTRLAKQLSANTNNESDINSPIMSEVWDFSSDDSESGREDDGISSINTTEERASNLATINGGNDKRSSRFVVEAHHEDDGSLGSPTTVTEEVKEENVLMTPTNNNVGETVDGSLTDSGDPNRVRKGRFSVLESVNVDDNTAMDKDPTLLYDHEEEEEGRTSRFQVEPTNVTSVMVDKNVVSARASPAPQSSRFQVSASQDPNTTNNTNCGMSGGEKQKEMDNHHLNNPNDHSLHNQFDSPYQAGPIPPPSRSPLIFVHPSQFDQLLLLNELVKQQLLELRNSATLYRHPGNVMGMEAAEYPHHPMNHQHGFSQYQEPNLRRVAEDPEIGYPQHYSAYSPNGMYMEPHNIPFEHPNHHYDPGMSSNIPSRRSMSIDYRQRPTSTTSVHNGNLYAPHTANNTQQRQQHRSQNSLKNTVLDVETLKRELEVLKRENDQLRKR